MISIQGKKTINDNEYSAYSMHYTSSPPLSETWNNYFSQWKNRLFLKRRALRSHKPINYPPADKRPK